jgi:hypothetical protein
MYSRFEDREGKIGELPFVPNLDEVKKELRHSVYYLSTNKLFQSAKW